jgi:phosphonatase-like hydrolase
VPIHNGADALVDLVVLDIAGTTVQEHGSVYVALHDAVAAAGGEPSSQDVAHWMGADKHEAIAALLSTDLRTCAVGDAQVAVVYEDFRTRLEQAYRQRPPTPMDGVPQALARLRRQGVKVALTTGFTREVTSSLLGSLGWDDAVVDAVVTVDDGTG